ncbi:MAG: PKD domain-containing protein, partial [Candidatus Woesearchaeota archaeon]|nr:PKD domain-containing protein [Candidatus Woesearchaeota archaeon]
PRNWTVTVNTTGYNDIPAEVNITANPSTGNYPLNVQFTSSVRGNSPIIYSWTFGDGAISNVPNPQHTYPNAGTYTATLTITDADGDIASAYIVITVTTSGASSDGNDEENKDHQAEYGLYIGRIKIFSDAEKNYGEEYVKAGHELYVDTFFENLGSKDLENIEYRVMMPDLGIMNAAKFNLDSGDHLTSRVVLDVPEGVKLGDYDVQISASNDQVRRVKYRFVTVIE